MAKAFTKCLGCGQPKFVNYSGLCKRCARNPQYAKIVEKAIAQHEHELEAQVEFEEQQAEAEEAVEETQEGTESEASESEEAPEAPEEPEKKE